MKTSQIYPHRKNKDGSYDSICPTCFLTVCSATSETDLQEREEAHLCAPSLLSKSGDYQPAHLKPRTAVPRLMEPVRAGYALPFLRSAEAPTLQTAIPDR
jgi:hypothetical protein